MKVNNNHGSVVRSTGLPVLMDVGLKSEQIAFCVAKLSPSVFQVEKVRCCLQGTC